MRYTSDSVAPHAALINIVHIALRYNKILQRTLQITLQATIKCVKMLKTFFLNYKGPRPFKLKKKYPATQSEIFISTLY
jgi:hypothetical protein